MAKECRLKYGVKGGQEAPPEGPLPEGPLPLSKVKQEVEC